MTCGNRLLYVSSSIVIAIIFSITGILIGRFAIPRWNNNINWKPTAQVAVQLINDEIFLKNLAEKFLDRVDANEIEKKLKQLSQRTHLAGTDDDRDEAIDIARKWREYGFDVTIHPYQVLLSYPDLTKPNTVSVTNENGAIIFQTNGSETIYAEDGNLPFNKIVKPFLAYSTNGTAESKKLYYVNYCTSEDFQMLDAIMDIADLVGSIIICRFGRIYRGNKLGFAQQYGAVGLILYNDPIDYAPNGTSKDKTYPNSIYMPDTGHQRGSVLTTNGDPLTKNYPATDYMYRNPIVNNTYLPKIPAQQIGYGEARRLLSSIRLSSYNSLQLRTVHNVIALLPGTVEPGIFASFYRDYAEVENRQKNTERIDVKLFFVIDRYVLIGSHFDAWTFGSIDDGSGTAVSFELARVFGSMNRSGWKPRRSLMICAWAAEEYGIIGSVEFVEARAGICEDIIGTSRLLYQYGCYR
ncbi:unnamed protein product [Didymodactylos carnosus]|uniref:Uncharacterized protein n=1 Tax=Didymodactylos carnosus TaxID=1234261 RepID=A0A814XMV7_9BILA|nr:unnamed protein product [Didymodactylos carnosus]CAF3982182.1 unnamed protein product [Didymodactylos carnosus]